MIVVLVVAASACTQRHLGSSSQENSTSTKEISKTWEKEPSTFMSIKLGAPLSVPECPSTNSYGIVVSRPEKTTGPCAEISKDNYFLGNMKAFFNVRMVLIDKNVEAVDATVYSFEWTLLRDALLEKYGPPQSITTEKVRTQAGVEYERETLTWIGQHLTIRAQSIGSDIEKSTLSAYSKAYSAKINADYGKQKTDLINSL